ncbi:multidrug transporter [Croceibacterium mercuriale]|uniref:Multidrug transporter n=1 Tax=Croceibacterium mercuriale TaxID=1572751 RepID=A0A0B2BYU3_9SPHN|nr:MATE family efflux transporter [Croceibacterium mercuriale]KHL24856.1 multidrug transporter [Croceibacterium mercuriale]
MRFSPALRAEIRATLHLAGPLVIAGLLQMALGATDIAFIARLGPEPLAAASLAVALFSVTVWALSGLSGQVGALAAAAIGARGPAVREVRRITRMGLWLAVASGLLAMAICAGGERLMLLTGQDQRIAAMSGDYLGIMLWSAIPLLLSNVLRAFVSTLGRPVFATVVALLSLPLNALGNYLLVFGAWGAPALGLRGAAIASVATALIGLLMYVTAIHNDRRLRRYYLFGNFWRPDWPQIRRLMAVGLPVSITIVAEAGLFGAAAFLMGRIGALELAAHTLALSIASLAFQVPFGIGQAATILVGYHFGAGDAAGVGRAGLVGMVLSQVFALGSAALMVGAPLLVLTPWIDTGNAANAPLVELAVAYLLVGAAFQLADGLQAVVLGALRGLQDTRTPMAYAIGGYWLVGFGLAIGLGFNTPLRGTGVWLGLAIGLLIVAVLLLVRWRRRVRLGLIAA